MRHLRPLAAFVAIAVVALFPATGAVAGYGAVAYDQDARKQGFAWDEPSQERANEAAKRDCGSDACKVRFGVGLKLCAALATPDSGPAWGGAVRKSVDAAKFAAMKNCQKHAGDKCVIRESKCNK
jgi:hypothetical protein